ncbi:MAG: tRNA (N6-threonylcarbamoyladenosine(37)-N6)-methyltransferase TrmO [Candidatus Hadarchaeia archaeon]
MDKKKLSQSDLDYLKTIYDLSKERKEIRTSDIASDLKVEAPSASEKLESLKRRGFVKHGKYGKVSLTKKGEKAGEKITDRRSDLKRFLKILGVNQNKAEADACKVEHVASKETIEKLRELYEFLKREQKQPEWSKFREQESGTLPKHKRGLKPIGVIHTPFDNDRDVPHQAYKSEETGEIEVFEKYEEGLKDIEGFSHVTLLYKFDRPIKQSSKEKYRLKSYGLTVKPYLDEKTHGLFATRSPERPNQIGISVVKLLDRKRNLLKVKGVDMLDKTPLLDIKPHVPKFDQREKTEIGWLENKL